MGFFKRISDILSANLNDLTERFENPEKMLKQAVCEMELSISDATGQVAKSMANEKMVSRELSRNTAQHDVWQDRAERAVRAGDDGLARKALARRNEHKKIIQALEDQLELAQEANGVLRRQLAGMKAKLAEGKRNLTTLSARRRAAEFRKKMTYHAAGFTVESNNAFAKFDRLKAKVEEAEAEAEAVAELRTMGACGVVEDIEEFCIPDDEADVTDELADLKRKLQAQN